MALKAQTARWALVPLGRMIHRYSRATLDSHTLSGVDLSGGFLLKSGR
jgi:hypothetical protein